MLKRLFLHNLSSKILALCLALFIYFYVLSEQNPIITRTFLLEVETKNLKEGLIIVSNIPPVNVELKGNRQILNLLTKNQVKAFLNFKGKNVGKHNLDIQLIAPENVELVNINPKDITVKLDKLITKKAKIEFTQIGEVHPDYVLTGINPDTAKVEVVGPQEEVNKIAYILATIDVTNVTKSFSKEVNLHPIDTLGNEVKNVVLTPHKIRINLEVTPLIYKEVKIEPKIIGKVADGYYIESIKLYPEKIIIRGLANKINDINLLTTSPINLNNTKENLEYDVTIQPEEGISKLSNETVRVSIVVNKKEE